jgi:hypothetical protein
MRIVVVSNTTMNPLAPHLAGHDLVFSGVGDMPAWLLDEGSPAAADDTDVVIVHADGDQLLPPFAQADATGITLDVVEEFARKHPRVQVVLNTLVPSAHTAWSHAEATSSRSKIVAGSSWNNRVCRIANDTANVSVLDMSLLLERHSRQELISATYWYAARVRYSSIGFELLGAH